MIRKPLGGIGVFTTIALVVMSCSDMGDEIATTFASSISNVQISPGQPVTVQIIGGTPPYEITENPDPALASALFTNPDVSPANLVITAAVNVPVGGTTRVRIRDSNGHSDVPAGIALHDDEITISITVSATPALVASSTLVTVGLGQQVSITISNGTPPYSIIESPIDSLATAVFVDGNVNPATLVIAGVTASGSTSVRVGDSSPLAQRRVLVSISVTEAPALSADPPSVSVEPTQQISVSVSSGTPPYIIAGPPESGIATAAFVNANTTPATLVVTGVASSGSTFIRIVDSSPSPQHEVRIPISAIQTPALTASPSSVTVGPGQTVNVSIGNGSPPYLITLAPNPGLATASFVNGNINPATLVITGVTIASAAGSTTVRVGDNSSPQRQVTVPITKTP